MADSDDKDKVDAALAKEVEEPKTPVETEAKSEDQTESTDNQTETTDDDQAKPEDSEEESAEESSTETPPSTFTKPTGYEWVKGDTLEEFNQNLITAYENSTKEALRLRQQPPATPASPAPAEGQPSFDINSIPEIQMLRAEQQTKMIDAFDDFAKKYPQAREPQAFDQFEKASGGASQAYVSAFGRVPTYPELFEKTAQLLSWQPSDEKAARKDAAIKEAGASTGTSNPTAAPAKPLPFNRKSLEIARRIHGNENKSDADLVKELTAAVAA